MTLLQALSDSITSAIMACPHSSDPGEEEASRRFYKAVHEDVFTKFKTAVFASKPLFSYTSTAGTRNNTDSSVPETEGIPQPAAGTSRRSMTLAEVDKLLAEHHTKELPGFYPYSPLVKLINEFQGQWGEAMYTCLGETADLLAGLLRSCVNAQFSRFPRGLEAVW